MSEGTKPYMGVKVELGDGTSGRLFEDGSTCLSVHPANEHGCPVCGPSQTERHVKVLTSDAVEVDRWIGLMS